MYGKTIIKSTFRLENDKTWQKSLKIGLTTIDACVEFDHRLRKELLDSEEIIKSLRARIYSLENTRQVFFNSPSYKILIFLQILNLISGIESTFGLNLMEILMLATHLKFLYILMYIT